MSSQEEITNILEDPPTRLAFALIVNNKFVAVKLLNDDNQIFYIISALKPSRNFVPPNT